MSSVSVQYESDLYRQRSSISYAVTKSRLSGDTYCRETDMSLPVMVTEAYWKMFDLSLDDIRAIITGQYMSHLVVHILALHYGCNIVRSGLTMNYCDQQSIVPRYKSIMIGNIMAAIAQRHTYSTENKLVDGLPVIRVCGPVPEEGIVWNGMRFVPFMLPKGGVVLRHAMPCAEYEALPRRMRGYAEIPSKITIDGVEHYITECAARFETS